MNTAAAKMITPAPNGKPVAVNAEKMAPHSVEAEEAVLGSILLMPDSFDLVLKEHLEAGHFFLDRNRWVFEALLKLRERGEAIDYVTAAEELRRQERLDDIGGAAYLTYLINHTPTSIYASAYAAIVFRAAYRREVLTTASELAQDAHAEASDIVEVEARVQEAMARLRLPGNEDTILRGSETVSRYQALLEHRTQQHRLYATPWPALNKYIMGIQPGTFLILTGFTGSGKTALCEAWAEFFAIHEEVRVCYAHTEVPVDTMLDRRLARHSGVPFIKLLKPATMSVDERWLVDEAMAYIKLWSGLIDFKFVEKDPTNPHAMNARRLLEYFRQEAEERGTKVFILDYFQDVQVDTGQRSRPEAYENFLYALRRFAEQTGSVLIVSSQMSETPYGSRTRGTRAMDCKAALQLDIHTSVLETPYHFAGHTWEAGERSPEVKIRLPKNTFGPPDVEFTLFYDGPRYWWRDMSEIESTRSGIDDLDVYRGGK